MLNYISRFTLVVEALSIAELYIIFQIIVKLRWTLRGGIFNIGLKNVDNIVLPQNNDADVNYHNDQYFDNIKRLLSSITWNRTWSTR